MTEAKPLPAAPILLDCTIRDGSYAIDFKFTAQDTALVAGLLGDAGVRYIEVGHGLGLGASAAGHGRGAVDDADAIAAARARTDALLGAFFIPGIGTVEHLRAGAAAGLDFVRMGQDADRIEAVIPFAEEARAAGLEVFVNFMKTYGVSTAQFAKAVRRLAEFEPAGVYIVDSAGGMTPGEVAGYVRAARDAADLPVGFHGHNNLELALANSLAAFEAGATFVDTTLCGIGRSSGNVPTEVMAAVFDRLGIDCGLDALALMDLAAAYVEPLDRRLPAEDRLTAVALGYGRLHSSYLGRALDAAGRNDVNKRRLIVELGRADPLRMTDATLDAAVEHLRSAPSPQRSEDLIRFADSRFAVRRIRNHAGAVTELVDALGVVAAKGGLAIALDLVASAALEEGELIAEHILDDDEIALGRLVFGSAAAAADALAGVAAVIDVALLDLAALAPGDAGPALAVLGESLRHALVAYRSPALELELLADAALAIAARDGARAIALVDPGVYAHADVAALQRALAVAVRVERWTPDAVIPAELCVVAGPAPADWPADGPPLVAIGARAAAGPGRLVLARDDALRGRLARWQRALATHVPAGAAVA